MDSRPSVMAAVLVCGLLAGACGDNVPLSLTKGTIDPAERICAPVVPAGCPTPAPGYQGVAPIIAQRCASCHVGGTDGPWALNDYDSVAAWGDLIRTDLLNCSMPPDDSDVVMPNKERQVLLTWIRCGYPE